jgi:hypothetical protein
MNFADADLEFLDPAIDRAARDPRRRLDDAGTASTERSRLRRREQSARPFDQYRPHVPLAFLDRLDSVRFFMPRFSTPVAKAIHLVPHAS